MLHYTSNERNVMLQMDIEDRVMSSIYFNIPLKEIDSYRKKLVYEESISDKTEALVSVPGAILFKDNSVVLKSDKLDFKSFSLLYILLNGIYNKEKFVNELSEINSLITNKQYLHIKQQDYEREMRNNKVKPSSFCNIKKLQSAFNKVKLKNLVFKEKLVVELNNIVLTSQVGDIKYKKIILFFNDWELEGYLLRFNNFDYSSYWGSDILLHPNLSLPYGRNGVLSWTKGDYQLFAETVKELVSNYNVKDNTFRNEIQPSYLRLRQLFAGLKYKGLSRASLSKEIMERHNIEIKLRKKSKSKELDI